ncbi:MAG: hypothetical protein FWD84_05010 [Oscillospiraceae bacterium]|nr:hypothetical protein [Oscillospiraceae bacterium]
MSKAYIYNPREYFWKVTLTGIVAVLALLASVVLILTTQEMVALYAIIILVCGYTIINTFIAKVYTSEVLLEEDGISFVAYGKTVKYRFDEIKRFMVKDWRGSGRMYVRVNQSSLLGGRYFLYCNRCNDGDELFLYILKLEYKTHPDSWKSKAWDSTRPKESKEPVLPWNLPPKETAIEEPK